MNTEIQDIRKKVIDKIIVISLIFLTPAYVAAIARWIEFGWLDINIILTVIYIGNTVLVIFRKRIDVELKLIFLVLIYLILGISALWYFGFSGIHYFVIIAIASGSILSSRKAAFLFMSITAILYLLIGILFMLKIHSASVDLNAFSQSIFQWTTIILSLIAFSVIFADGFGELYHQLVKKVEDNKIIHSMLEAQNQELNQTHKKLYKKVEEIHEVNLQLQISEEKYRDLVNFSPDVIYWYSTAKGALFCSDRTKDMVGYNPSELEGDPECWRSLIHPGDIKKLDRAIENLLIGNTQDVEYRMKTKDGKWIWVNDTFTIIRETTEEKIIQGHLSDITERKTTEEQLRDSELRWQFSVDGSNLGLWDWNLTNNEVFFSKKWKEMLGFKEDEVENSFVEWEKRVHPEDLGQVMEVINKYLRGETEKYSNEHRMKCKDGSYKWIFDRGKIVSYSSDGKPIRMIGTHSDIHEKKIVELELKKNNATKDRFFSIIAHDLKNPFNSMIGLSEVLNDNFEELDKKTQKKFVTAIHDGILKTYDLLEDLLLWSRAQRNTIDFFPKSLDLLMVSTDVMEPLRMAADNKQIELLVNVLPGTEVVADQFMLSFILRNIVSNAIKFTPVNGKIVVDSETIDSAGKKWVQIAVHDSGIGIDEKYMERIFDIGQNVSRPGTQNEKGTGMGLPICYEFVKKHDGEIWVESTPGKGSNFYFTMPRNT